MNEVNTDAFKPRAVPDEIPSRGNPAPASQVATTEPLMRLAAFVEDQFRINRDHRNSSGVNEKLEYAARCAKMKFSPRQEAILVDCKLNPKSYPPVTAMKNRSMMALLNDIIKSSGDKPYSLSPTPKPDIPKSAKEEIIKNIAKEIVDYVRQRGVAFQSEQEVGAFYTTIIMRVMSMYDEVRHAEYDWAKERCERMDQKIHDQLVEANFMKEFGEMIDDVCTYGTALLVGPCPHTVARCKCKEIDDMEGGLKYTREYVTIPTFDAVSPWDCYPAPNAKEVDEGPLCIKIRYTANVLWQYAEAESEEEDKEAKEVNEGWQRQTVRQLLSRYPKGGCRLPLEAYDLVRREAENDSLQSADDCTLEGIRCFASVRGSMLIEFGINKTQTGEAIVYHKYYRTETIVIGGYVVYCRIIDDRMIFPVSKAVLYKTPGSWWGDSIADYCRVPQDMQNNAIKNLTINGNLSSNPMYQCTNINDVVSLDGSPALALRAGKMFGFKRQPMSAGVGNPISMIQVPSTVKEQMEVLNAAMKLADDYSGIPQYTVGSTAQLGGGAGRTASGLSMMEAAATRIVSMCVYRLGRDVIIPVVKNLNIYNLLFDDDMSIKGDVEVNPTGLMGKILREAESQRRQQTTAMLGQHPILSGAMTVEAFFELIRPELEGCGVNPDKVIPSKERMEVYQMILDAAQAAKAAGALPDGGGMDVGPTPEQARMAQIEGNPAQVAMTQGAMAQEAKAGTVAERRGAA